MSHFIVDSIQCMLLVQLLEYLRSGKAGECPRLTTALFLFGPMVGEDGALLDDFMEVGRGVSKRGREGKNERERERKKE